MVNNSDFAGPLRCTIIPHLCHFSMNACVCVHEVTSIMSDSFASPWTVAHQAPLFMGFSRQEYWSGLPCPSPGDPPDPGIETRSPTLQVDSFYCLSHSSFFKNQLKVFFHYNSLCIAFLLVVSIFTVHL